VNASWIKLPAIVLSLFALSACTPDELELTVYSSDVQAAASGEAVEIPAIVTFSMVGEDDKGLLRQASDLASRWLPPDSKIEITKSQFGKKLVVETKVPLMSKPRANEIVQAKRPLIYLEVDGSRVTLRKTSHLDVLNRELRNMNMMLGVSMPARSTTVALVGDRPPKGLTLGATAVFVNDRPVLELKEPIAHRRTINISFSGRDGSVYKDMERIPPSFTLTQP
jgi:hypothetical protein